MNANELADELLKYSIPRLFELDELIHQSATMLRQQQAEINTLRTHGYKTQYELLRLEFLQQQAEIESLLKFIGERGETGQLIIWKAQEK